MMKKIIKRINHVFLLLLVAGILAGCSEDENPTQSTSTLSTLNVVPSPRCGVTLSTDPACGAIINRTNSTLRIAVDGSNGFEVEVTPHTALITRIGIESSHDFRVDVIDPSIQAERAFQYFLFVDNVAADQIVDIGQQVFMGWFFEVNDVRGQFTRLGG